MRSDDALDLIQQGRALAENKEGYAEAKIAVLGDSSTQHLTQILRACLHRRRMFARVYEAEYDVVDQEIFAPESELYRFAPDYVILYVCAQAFRERYYRGGFQGRKLVEEAHARTLERWKTINERLTCRIIQNTLAVPGERAFGNFSLKVPDSLDSALTALNDKVAVSSRQFANVFLNDVEYLAAFAGKKAWNDEKSWIHAKMLCGLDFVPAVAENIADIILAGEGRAKKCIVLDLDNTLWGGVVGDDGPHGIAIGGHGEGEAFARFQAFLLSLKERGVILAVCSKNDHENAVAPFRENPEMVLRETDISAFVANWDNKVANIRKIAATLNIGLDAMVFIDDSPFERNQVRDMLPEVCVPEIPEDSAEFAPFLSSLNLFETLSFSPEDASRTDFYRTQVRRDQEKAKFSSVDDFLRSLEMEASVARFDPRSLARAAQLVQRSNQFNLTTRRYNEAECAAFMRDAQGCLPITVSLKDKFGDHGLIGVIILKFLERKAVIDSWIMSCRVLQRGVEGLCMNRVFEFARARGLETVEGEFIPTPKNSMVRDFYPLMGFKPASSEPGGRTVWELSVADHRPARTHIACRESPVSGGRLE